MKSAVISFILTVAAVAAAFVIWSPQPVADARSHAVTAAASGDQSPEAPAAAKTPPEPEKTDSGDAIEREIRLNELAIRAGKLTKERPTGGVLIQWWELVCAAAEDDPLRAIAMAREAPEEFQGDRLHHVSGTVEDIVAWWMARDPEDALAWYWKDAARRTLDGEPPEEMVQTLARRDVSRAIGFVRQYLELVAGQGGKGMGFGFSTTGDGQRLMEVSYLSQVFLALQPFVRTAADFEVMATLAEVIPDPARRAGFHQTLISHLAESQEPASVRDFLNRHPVPADWPEGFAHPAAALVARGIAAGGDVAEWIAWGQKQLSVRSDLRSQFITQAVKSWVARDPEAVGDWLQQMRQVDPAAASVAARAYADTVLNEDPAAAMAWIAALPDESARRQNMLRHFPRWAECDPVAARAWLEASSWPEEIKRLAGAVLPKN